MKSLIPIIILGAPRSGTTLMRVLLGQHPQIVDLPETPWVGGGYTPFSIRGLEQFLVDYEKGPVRMLGAPKENIQRQLSKLLHTTLMDNPLVQVEKPNAQYVVIKTPDDSAYPEFLARQFPDAYFIHIIRDGRDVAHSTMEAFADAKNARSLVNDKSYLLTYSNAIKRWIDLENDIVAIKSLTKSYQQITYESLAINPNRLLGKLAEILEIENLADWREYGKASSAVLPEHERGSQDVAQQKKVSNASVYRWPSLIGPEAAKAIDERWGEDFKRMGYPLCKQLCPIRQDIHEPLFMRNAKDLNNPMPFSRFSLKSSSWLAFMKGTCVDFKKSLAKHYYKELCRDVRNPLQ